MSRLLLVDDAIFMRKMLGDILMKNGHLVVGEASNGNEAYAQYKALKPDIVMMDITMPECDGITGVKKIMGEFPDAIIIMCSAMGQKGMVMQAIAAGAKDFVVKPFSASKIIESVGKFG